MMRPRIDVTRDQIAQVVSAFYAAVRSHDVMGPIFAAHVDKWPEHEAKITRFWASAILLEGSFEGNPMMAHLQAGNVDPEHFAIWLALFDEVLEAEIPMPQRSQWSTLAHRIGFGLSSGLRDSRRPRGAVPTF